MNSLRNIVESRLFGDARIIFVRRSIAEDYFSSEGAKKIDDLSIRWQNELVNNIYSEISNIKEISIIDIGIDSFATDDLAPYGLWKFHPTDEFFLLALAAIADEFSVGRQIKTRLIRHAIEEKKLPVLAERARLIQLGETASKQLAAMSADLRKIEVERDDHAVLLRAAQENEQRCAAALEALTLENGELKAAMSELERDKISAQIERNVLAEQLRGASIERAQIGSRTHLLAAEVDRLNSIIDEQKTLHETLDAQLMKLSNEKNDLSAKYADLQREFFAARKAIRERSDDISQADEDERTGIIVDGELIRPHATVLSHSIEVLFSERDQLARQVEAYGAEKQALVAHVSTIEKILEAIRAERDELAIKLQAAEARSVMIAAEELSVIRERHEAEKQTLESERDSSASKITTLERDLVECGKQNLANAAEIAVLVAAVEKSQADYRSLEDVLNSVRMERDHLQSKIEDYRSTHEWHVSQLNAVYVERDWHIKQVATLQAALEKYEVGQSRADNFRE